jgi:hypothetical protein
MNDFEWEYLDRSEYTDDIEDNSIAEESGYLYDHRNDLTEWYSYYSDIAPEEIEY